jgi:hypothetical protein
VSAEAPGAPPLTNPKGKIVLNLIVQLPQFMQVMLGCVSFIALASDPVAPCGPSAKQPAETLTGHLRAMANHARAISVLVARKSGASGGE